VARNQSTSNLSHVRSLSLQDRDPAWAQPPRE
jgi:hypothetical protein